MAESDRSFWMRRLAQERNWLMFRTRGMLSAVYALEQHGVNRRDCQSLRHILADIITRQIPRGHTRRVRQLEKRLKCANLSSSPTSCSSSE